jgi:hypothetical protein
MCAADSEAVEVAEAHDLLDQLGVVIGERYVFDPDAGPLEEPRGGSQHLFGMTRARQRWRWIDTNRNEQRDAQCIGLRVLAAEPDEPVRIDAAIDGYE